jgi:carbonic anhydrase
MEYACKVAGSKLILVMGHESCGAVKSAIDQVELGNITELLDKIKPAIELSADFNPHCAENPNRSEKSVNNPISYQQNTEVNFI